MLRDLIEKIVLRPGSKRGDIEATLHGELHTILEWVERQAIGKAQNTNPPGALASGVSVSGVTGTCNHRYRQIDLRLDRSPISMGSIDLGSKNQQPIERSHLPLSGVSEPQSRHVLVVTI